MKQKGTVDTTVEGDTENNTGIRKLIQLLTKPEQSISNSLWKICYKSRVVYA